MDISKKDIDAVMADVVALKRDLAKAIEKFKSSTEDTVGSAQDFVEDIRDELAGIYKDTTKRGQRATKTVSKRVEDQPITSLVIAFSVGFIVSRLISR